MQGTGSLWDPPGRFGGYISGAPLCGTPRPSSGQSGGETPQMLSRIESSPGQRPPCVAAPRLAEELPVLEPEDNGVKTRLKLSIFSKFLI